MFHLPLKYCINNFVLQIKCCLTSFTELFSACGFYFVWCITNFINIHYLLTLWINLQILRPQWCCLLPLFCHASVMINYLVLLLRKIAFYHKTIFQFLIRWLLHKCRQIARLLLQGIFLFNGLLRSEKIFNYSCITASFKHFFVVRHLNISFDLFHLSK